MGFYFRFPMLLQLALNNITSGITKQIKTADTEEYSPRCYKVYQMMSKPTKASIIIRVSFYYLRLQNMYIGSFNRRFAKSGYLSVVHYPI